MKTLPNINPEHLAKFKEFIHQGLAYRSYGSSGNPPSLLEWAREISDPYLDFLVSNDAQPEIFSNAFRGVKVIALVSNTNNIYHLADAEPDIVHFSIPFEDPYTQGIPPTDENLELLFTLVMVIMLSDCSGCCNALDQLVVSKAGIYATGDVSMTYYS